MLLNFIKDAIRPQSVKDRDKKDAMENAYHSGDPQDRFNKATVIEKYKKFYFIIYLVLLKKILWLLLSL